MNIVLQWYYRYTGSRACCCGCVVVEGFIRGFWFFHLVHASGANLSRYLQIESRVEAVPAVQRPKVRACNRTGPVKFCDHGDPVLVHVHRVNTAIDITNSDCRENDTKESMTCNISIIINIIHTNRGIEAEAYRYNVGFDKSTTITYIDRVRIGWTYI